MIIIRQEGSTTLYINPATIAMVKEITKKGQEDKILLTTTYGKDIPLSGERAQVFMEQFTTMIDPDVIAAELAELKVTGEKYANFENCDPTLLKKAYDALMEDNEDE